MAHSVESEKFLPLSEATYLIMLSLSQGPKHGYAIIKDVQALSNGAVVLSTGTLYGAIKRLLEQAWIEPVNHSALPEPGRVRKAYMLTRLGQDIIQAEIARLQRLLAAAQLRRAGEQT